MKMKKKLLSILTAAALLSSAVFVNTGFPAAAVETGNVKIPLSQLDVVYAGTNNQVKTMLMADKIFDGDETTTWSGDSGGTMVFDLGGYYDISEINVIQTTNNNRFTIFASAVLDEVKTISNVDWTVPQCIYGDHAGVTAGVPINTKRTLNITAESALHPEAVTAVRYLNISRANALHELEVYGRKVADASDARIQLVPDMVIESKDQTGANRLAHAQMLVDGIYNSMQSGGWNVGVNSYFVIDLGAKYRIEKLQMYGTNNNNAATQLSYYAANALEDLQDISALTPFASPLQENSLDPEMNITVLSQEVTARYIKVCLAAGTSIQFRELRIYGKEANVPTNAVTFDPMNGETATVVNVEVGAAVGRKLPANPDKSGMAFAGWYYEADGVETAFTADMVINAGLSVYAKYTTAYTVTFMDGDTVYYTAQKVAAGALLSDIMPEAPGFVEYEKAFCAWKTADGTVVDNADEIHSDYILYAQYANYFQVTRDNLIRKDYRTEADGLQPCVDKLFDHNTATYHNESGKLLVQIDLKAFYDISYLKINKNKADGTVIVRAGATLGSMNEIINDTTNLYAEWKNPTGIKVRYLELDKNWSGGSELSFYGTQQQELAEYTVSFPGTELETITVHEGDLLTLPEAPAVEGLTFAGWYTDSGFLNSFNPQSAVTENIELYARYAARINFVPEDGTVSSSGGISGFGTALTNILDGDYDTVLTSADGTVLLDLGASFDIARSVITTYNYVLSNSGERITLRFSADAAFTAPVTAVLNDIYETTTTGSRIVRHHAANFTAEAVRFVEITLPQNTANTNRNLCDIELFGAKIEGSELYRVTYDLNGGTGTTPIGEVLLPGAAITLPVAVDAFKAQSTFAGWALAPDAAEPISSLTMGSAPLTLYAVWAPASTYALTLVSYNARQTYDMLPGNSLTLPSPKRSGYLFDGWFKSDGTKYEGEIYTGTEQDVILTARWKFVLTAVTQLDSANNSACGTVTGIGASGYYYGESALLSAQATEDYKFTGWFEKHGSTVKLISCNQELNYKVTDSATLYARFAAKTAYTVSFVDQSGTVYYTKNVIEGETVGTLPNISGVYGYDFDGWYSTTRGGTKLTAETVINSDRTVFAQFTAAQKLFALSVSGGYINGNSANTSGSFGFLDRITLTAVIPEGQQFLYWQNADGVILSRKADYSFEVKSDSDISAVFGAEAVEATPVTGVILADKNVSAKKMSFVITRDIPEGYELIEAGALVMRGVGAIYTHKLALLDDFSVADNAVIKAMSIYDFKQGSTIQNVSVIEPENPVSIRSYLICRNADGDYAVFYSVAVTAMLETVENEPPVVLQSNLQLSSAMAVMSQPADINRREDYEKL